MFGWNSLVGALAVLLCTLSQTAGTEPQRRIFQQEHPAAKSSFIFREVEPVIRRESGVPPRLPQFLPDVDERHPIYAIIQSANRSAYDILLALERPCEGQNNCTYGTVRGSKSPFSIDNGRTIPLKLRDGIEGHFIEAECHSYCSQAYMRWKEKDFYYSIGIKAEKMETLVEVANSAIGSGKS